MKSNKIPLVGMESGLSFRKLLLRRSGIRLSSLQGVANSERERQLVEAEDEGSCVE